MKLHLPKTLVALVAAAALQAHADTSEASSTVWGWDGAPTANGTAVTYDTVSVTCNNTNNVNLGGQSGDDIKFEAVNSSGQTVDNGHIGVNSTITADSIWLSSSRYNITDGSRVSDVDAIYAVGGQLYLDNTTVDAHVFLGKSNYSGDTFEALNGAALRVQQNSTLSSVTLVQDAKICAFSNTTDSRDIGTISNLDLGANTLTKSGSGKLSISALTGTGSIKVTGGTLDLASGVTANISEITSGSAISGAGKVVVAAGASGLTVGTMTDFTGDIVINQGQTLTANTTGNDSGGLTKGDVYVNGGGKLVLNVQDTLGWNNRNGVKNLILEGDSQNKAVMEIKNAQTLVSVIQLNGDTEITKGTSSASFSSFKATNDSNAFVAKIAARGKNNTNGVGIQLRENLVIDVDQNGEFTQTADITCFTSSQAWTGTLTKTGEGKMVLGDNVSVTLANNNSTHNFEVSKGSVEMKGGSSIAYLDKVKVTVKNDGSGASNEPGPARSGGDEVPSATLKNVTISGNGITGSANGGSIDNATVKLGTGTTLSNVALTAASLDLADATSVSMSNVVFGAGTTVSYGTRVTLAGSNTIELTEISVGKVTVADNVATVVYQGLSDINFGSTTVNLKLTQDFISALQLKALPDAAQILTIDFTDANIGLTGATIGPVNVEMGAAFPTLDSVIHAGNKVTLNFREINAIPEPATATLSLLALAGLAARRRRK